jgi:hypothetical protein
MDGKKQHGWMIGRRTQLAFNQQLPEIRLLLAVP